MKRERRKKRLQKAIGGRYQAECERNGHGEKNTLDDDEHKVGKSV